MFAQAKLADREHRVKPDASRQRGTGVAEWASRNLGPRAGWTTSPDDLNCTNRLVRTRMPGGVGGNRSGILHPCLYPKTMILDKQYRQSFMVRLAGLPEGEREHMIDKVKGLEACGGATCSLRIQLPPLYGEG
jgi:hypothetical protein